MNSRERILVALNRGKPDRVPFFDHINRGMQQRIMGRDDFDELDLAREMQFDAFYCGGMRPPFFAEMEVMADGRTAIKRGLIKKRDDLKIAKFPVIDESFFECPKKFLNKYHDKGYALYAPSRMGHSGVLNSMGIDGFSYALTDDPYVIETLMDMYAEWVIRVIERMQEMGFDFLWFSDDIAFKSGPLVSPQVFREVFIPRLKKITESIRLPWIYHSDGNLMPLLEDLLSLGMNGLNPIEPGAMDIEEVKRDYGQRICIMGNIDLHYTLTRGTVEEVEQEVKKRIELIGKDGGYIISSANSIPDYCKLENVIAMRDAIIKYR